MTAHRTILHIDMDAFFAAIEQLDDPSIRGKPVLVGYDGPRGVVTTASYEARPFGCHSAQPMVIAKRCCPNAIVVPVRGGRYREVHDQVFNIFESFTPLIEPLSIDEAFLDVTGSERLFGSGPEIAAQIRERIRVEIGLTASVGVAPNKFLAKLASEMDKPDGMTVIAPETVQQTLESLPISRVFGIGPVAEGRLHRVGVRTIGDLQRLSMDELETRFGSNAEWFHRLARGMDDRPVVPDGRAKSIGHEQTFGADVADKEHLRRVMLGQTEQIARRLRRHGLQARTVTIKLRYGDFETITRARTLERPTDRTDLLWRAASGLFETWMKKEGFRPVRLLGVTSSGFAEDDQMDLFPDPEDVKGRTVDGTTDAIIAKFGTDAIRRGGTMKEP